MPAGTTGFPKAATLSHRNIVNNGLLVGAACRYTEADRWVAPWRQATGLPKAGPVSVFRAGCCLQWPSGAVSSRQQKPAPENTILPSDRHIKGCTSALLLKRTH